MNEEFGSLYKFVADRANVTSNSLPDLLKCAHYKRYAAFLAYNHTLHDYSNEASCLVLEDKLKEYSNFIDDRKGVNNYASVLRSLADNVSNESKSWKSNLSSSVNKLKVEELIKPYISDCLYQSANGCTSGNPSEDELQAFSQTMARIQSDNIDSSLSYKNNPSFDESKLKKASLYSTYEEAYDQPKPDTVCKSSGSLVQQRLPFQHPSKSKFCGNVRGKDKVEEDDEVVQGRGKRRGSDDRIRKLNKCIKDDDDEEEKKQTDFFKTASQALKLQSNAKHGMGGQTQSVKKSLGGKGRAASGKFVPPLRSSQEEDSDMLMTRAVMGRNGSSNHGNSNEPEEDERLRNLDPRMIELIRSEIMDQGSPVSWEDIAGLDFAKHTIQEIVVWPMLRPDIFTGLRRPPKGILLFGPPGTGKTLIGKCIASQSKATFFSISASSLTSKWIGDGEKMVRALFAVARVEQPSVVFIDEIDSLLSQRSDQEHESSRRIKTEFLVQLDGAGTGEEDRILIIGATNRPQELDEAARRRLVKRLYIPLPDLQARKVLIANLMRKEKSDLTDNQMEQVATLTEGYSGADMRSLCQEACLGPIRSLPPFSIANIDPDQVRPVNLEDFTSALKRVRSSVSSKDLDLYVEWDKQFGMSS